MARQRRTPAPGARRRRPRRRRVPGLLGGDCSELADQWLDALDAVGPTVTKASTAIRQEVGPDVPVVVVPYPVPLDDDGCRASALTRREHRFLHDYALRLDEVLEGAAAGAGFHDLDEMVTASATSGCGCATGRPTPASTSWRRIRSRAWSRTG